MSDNQQQYLTVGALTKYLKRKFDVDPHLQQVYVVGEVTNYRQRPNSHQYFSLKDSQAKISAVMYKTAFSKLQFNLEEGMKVFAIGRITLYEPSGSYQLVIEHIQPDGVGALYQRLEQLKQQFKAQGLLDIPKKEIPRFPQRIVVITSPSGAVIRDILTTINRRYPIVEVLVIPSRVQGKEATKELIDAFHKVKERANEFDTVIVARGGGSIEDLWCFNEEAVARAIIECPLPVISSIGHETDTTLADLVADMRAPTPTAAAELAVPVLVEWINYLKQLEDRLRLATNSRIQYLQKYLDRFSASYVLKQPERLYQSYSQQLDIAHERLMTYQKMYLNRQVEGMTVLTNRLMMQQPERLIHSLNNELDGYNQRLRRAVEYNLTTMEQTFHRNAQLLDAFSPLNSIARGYSIVTRDGQIIKEVDQVQIGDTLQMNLIDGTVHAQVMKTDSQPLLDYPMKGMEETND